jgi:hypothetical protein
MNKVLITGGAGYLGSVMSEVLLSKGYSVTVLDNLIYKQLSLTTFCHNKNFKFVYGDVRDSQLLSDLVETHDIIIPLAAIVGMPACKKDPELTVAVNYEQIKDIVAFMWPSQKLLVPIVHSIHFLYMLKQNVTQKRQYWIQEMVSLFAWLQFLEFLIDKEWICLLTILFTEHLQTSF